jgi:SAM-dependent methyltransferase
MSLPPLESLRCPDCRGPLDAVQGGGTSPYRCPSCDRAFPLVGRVLDLSPLEAQKESRRTVEQFGDSWSSHEYLAPYQEKQFLDWIAPLTAEDFQGKAVLEAGCGKGRHSFLVAGLGPADLTCVDLSNAVVIAAEYTKAFPHVHCVRADLTRLPMKDERQDIVFCLGVLHHLPDPELGLKALWGALKPGGTLCLWVYGREGNGWIVHLVDPVRKRVTSKIPTKVLRPLLLPLTLALYALLKLAYGPATRKGARVVPWLPYSAYLGYISKFPFREVEHIVLDHLCPPIAHYLSRPVLEEWFSRLGPEQLAFRWHNRNSWNVVARKAGAGGRPQPASEGGGA